MSVATYTKSGNKATTSAKLDKSVFDVKVTSHDLLKQAYITYLANGRTNLAKTLKRGEVRGGGKKPWKQKGTGRARFGSIRVPIWRGGGITFGPLGKENYSKKMPINAKRTAIRQALSLKAQTGNVVVIESLDIKNGKTSEVVTLFNKIGLQKSVLLVVEDKTPEIIRAVRNLEKVTLVQAQYVNTYDVLNAENVVITQKALEIVHTWLGLTKVGASATKVKEGKK